MEKKMNRSPILSLSLLLTLGLVACSEAPEVVSAPNAETAAVEAEPAAIPVVSVDETAALIEAGTATAVDAKSDDTRASHGTLPGARLLTSSSDYDTAAELPANHDDTLVFYCANEHCSASDAAAHRAVAAGYDDVRVMRAGILGWEAAGKPTQPAS
jgi:rhodanese-related sulfurtransferase